MKASLPLLPKGLLIACLLPVTLRAADVDNDGLDDLWQQRYNIAPFKGSEDPDGDGRINLVESRNFSNPNKPDMSQLGIVMIRDLNPVDGLHDPWQTQFGITAAQKWEDPDGDGRTNLEESMSKSHPFVADAPFSLVGVLTPAVERPGPDSFIARVPDSAQGRRYILEVSDTLLPGSWVTATMINNGSPYQWGTGEELSGEALTGNATKKFFRWKIDDPDTDGDFIPDWMEMQLGTDLNLEDSDGDGIPDGNEYGGGTDALAANTPQNSAELEKEGQIPSLSVGYRYKMVSNTWGRNETGWAWSSLEWETGPSGGMGGDWAEAFAPIYATKLGELSYPTTESDWDNWTTGVIGISGGYAKHIDHSTESLEYLYATATHVQTVLRTSVKNDQAPWIMSRLGFRVLRKKSTASVAYPDTPEVSYSDISTVQLRIPKGKNVSDAVLTREPAVEEGQEVMDMWITPDVSSPTAMALDDVSTVNLSAAPKPDRWLMLPQGTTGSVYIPTVGWSSEAVYKAQGVSLGEDGNGLLTHQLNRVTLQGNSPGTAAIYTGFKGTNGDPLFPTEPAVRVAVYEPKEVDLLLVPIAFMRVPGGLITSPQDLPTQAALQSYLDDVFLRQCNVKVNVTYAPEVPVVWDVGLGPAMNDTLYRRNHDRFLQVTSPTTDSGDYMTAEENAILTAAPPKVDPNTVTLYYVVTNDLIWVRWTNPVDETNKELSRLVFQPLFGFAPGKPTHIPNTNSLAHIAWVADRKPMLGDDVRYTIAHEVGHKLGLAHSTEQQKSNGEFNPAYLTNGDNENRLMTGRVGSKRAQGPRTLTHAEWVSIRQSELLKKPQNTP